MSKALITLAEKVYKLTEEQVAELEGKSEEEVSDFIVALDAKRLKKANTESYDKGFRKAKVEVLTDFEKDIAEKFELDGSLKGIELVEAVADKVRTEAAGKGETELTDDAVKKHPLYVALDKSVNAKVKATETEWKTKLEAKDKEFHQKDVQAKVKTIALAELDALNPILPEDAEKAARIKAWWLKDLTTNSFDVDEEGNVTLLDKDGQPKQDEHGNAIDFKDFLKNNISTSFELPASEKRSAPNNGDKKDADTGKNKPAANLPKPKNIEELTAALEDAKYSVEEKQTIHAAYEASGGK